MNKWALFMERLIRKLKRGHFFMFQKRCKKLFALFLVFFVVLTIGLFYFQIIAGESLSKSASAQRITDLEIEKPRGDIVDRNLIPLTYRNKKVSIVLKPLYLRENKEGLRKVCEILGLDFNSVEKQVETRREPIIFETDEEKKDLIMGLNIYGLSSINSLKRYDKRSVAKHILGYVNKVDQVGETGIEKFYEDVLKFDKENAVGVITDARNNLLQGLGYRMFTRDSSNKRLNIKLTIDYHIQRIAEDVMDRNGITGAVVIEDVYSGDIVAIVSKPDFEQDHVEKYLQSPQKELFNRAVAAYNLGSIFKIIVAAILFETKEDPEEEFFCPGYIRVGNNEFRCTSYAEGGHGLINLTQAFAKSCNPYFINEGIKIGYRNLLNKAKDFGLGSVTGVKEQGIMESAGNLPDVNGYHSKGDIANISIGQGDIMATPLQVADLVATVANGGIKNRVNIVDSVVDDDGNKVRDLRFKEGTRVISKEVSEKIKQLMEEVTATGTGTEANLDRYGGAGGKTGSAETGNKDVVHAWFAGYFSKLSPRYSMAVFVENGQYGGKVAAPIFAEIAREILRKGY